MSAPALQQPSCPLPSAPAAARSTATSSPRRLFRRRRRHRPPRLPGQRSDCRGHRADLQHGREDRNASATRRHRGPKTNVSRRRTQRMATAQLRRRKCRKGSYGGGGMGGRSEMTRPACRTRAAARAAASSSMRPRRAASCTAVVAPNPSPIPAAAAATLGQRRRQRLWSRRRRRLGGSSTPARERKRPAWQPASRQYGASPDGPPHMPAYPSPKRP